MDPRDTGIVLRAHSSRYAVLAANAEAVIECRARRRLDRPSADWPEFPVPGDEVEWRPTAHGVAIRDGVIEAVRPRRSEISRTRFGQKHVVVANLDLLVVVVAMREPAVDRGLLDRLLATAERTHIEALVCFSKVDLADAAELQALRAVYQNAGYDLVETAAATGVGIDPLRERLRGRVAALMGASGAGKSRLLAALQPGLQVRTGEVNSKSGQGRHTTTRVDLHRTDFGALLADTPGVREFNLWQLEPELLGTLFREFARPSNTCKFEPCTHVHEPECAIESAVRAGAIDRGRYKSYVALFEELQAESKLAASRGGRGGRRE
jgi:ribosome biogenesis GTPase